MKEYHPARHQIDKTNVELAKTMMGGLTSNMIQSTEIVVEPSVSSTLIELEGKSNKS